MQEALTLERDTTRATSSTATILWAAGSFALIYFALDLNKLYALRYGADMGTFLQTFVNLRHGSSWNFGEWRPHFQVHDSWTLSILVPVLALAPRAETLLAAQVVIVAAAAVPLVLFAREIGVSSKGANILGIAYLLTPSAQGLAYDNFSENVFVPLLAFLAALAVRKRAFWLALLFAQLLMGVKEDEILFVAWFGAACMLRWDRRLGLGVVMLAVANGIAFWSIEALHATAPHDPSYGLAVHDAGGKITMVVLLLAPFACAPLGAGRWLFLAVPMLAEIVLMQPWWYEPSRIGSHAVAPLLAAASIAAAFGLRRYPVLERAVIPCAIVVILLIFNDTVLRPGRWPYIVDWRAYARAVAVRDTTRDVVLPRGEEGIWAVAALNPRVRLANHPDPHWVSCPAYNTNARAFFDSLLGRPLPPLCGGVPIANPAAPRR